MPADDSNVAVSECTCQDRIYVVNCYIESGVLQQPVSKMDAATQCEAEEAGGPGSADPVPSAQHVNAHSVSVVLHGMSGA